MDKDLLLVVAERIAPGVAELDETRKERVMAEIERAVGARPLALQRQLTMFLNIMRWAPVARYGREFDRLSPAQQDAVLRWFMDAPVARLRQGFWGVKTLVYMGYYGLPEVADRIGYRPSRNGNVLLTQQGPGSKQRARGLSEATE